MNFEESTIQTKRFFPRLAIYGIKPSVKDMKKDVIECLSSAVVSKLME